MYVDTDQPPRLTRRYDQHRENKMKKHHLSRHLTNDVYFTQGTYVHTIGQVGRVGRYTYTYVGTGQVGR